MTSEGADVVEEWKTQDSLIVFVQGSSRCSTSGKLGQCKLDNRAERDSEVSAEDVVTILCMRTCRRTPAPAHQRLKERMDRRILYCGIHAFAHAISIVM